MSGILYDRADYTAVTRRNGADTGKLFFGCGVVQGTDPGREIALPATGATADKFEGVAVYGANVEMDDYGAVRLEKNQILDVCQAGKLLGALPDSSTRSTAMRCIFVVTGDDAGKFTSTASKDTNIAIKARFLGAAVNGIAPAQFYDVPQV